MTTFMESLYLISNSATPTVTSPNPQKPRSDRQCWTKKGGNGARYRAIFHHCTAADVVVITPVHHYGGARANRWHVTDLTAAKTYAIDI
jgi:hypothetical protein